MARYTNEGAEVAVELEGWEGGVGDGVERVDVLGDDTPDDSHLPQVSDCPVSVVGPSLVEGRPAEEGPRPVAFPGFVGGDEFVVVDGSVGFVEGICARSSPVVSQSGCYRQSGPGEEHGLCIAIPRLAVKVGGVWSGEESLQGMYGSCRGIGTARDDDRRW